MVWSPGFSQILVPALLALSHALDSREHHRLKARLSGTSGLSGNSWLWLECNDLSLLPYTLPDLAPGTTKRGAAYSRTFT